MYPAVLVSILAAVPLVFLLLRVFRVHKGISVSRFRRWILILASLLWFQVLVTTMLIGLWVSTVIMTAPSPEFRSTESSLIVEPDILTELVKRQATGTSQAATDIYLESVTPTP